VIARVLRTLPWALAVLSPCLACVADSGVERTLHSPDELGVELRLPEGGVPLNEHFTLEVLVSGVEPRSVLVDADMPAHRHGMLSAPIVSSRGEGLYRVEGMLMHMPGDWVISVVLEGDGLDERLDFPLSVDFDLPP